MGTTPARFAWVRLICTWLCESLRYYGKSPRFFYTIIAIPVDVTFLKESLYRWVAGYHTQVTYISTKPSSSQVVPFP